MSEYTIGITKADEVSGLPEIERRAAALFSFGDLAPERASQAHHDVPNAVESGDRGKYARRLTSWHVHFVPNFVVDRKQAEYAGSGRARRGVLAESARCVA